MQKFVLTYEYGDEFEGGTSYKTFEYESKDKALFDLELEFERVVALERVYQKEVDQIHNRIHSTNNPEKKLAGYKDLRDKEESYKSKLLLRIGNHSFPIDYVSYRDSETNKYKFYANISTLEDWFSRNRL